MTKTQIEISCKVMVVCLILTFLWTCARVLGMIGLL